MPTTAHPVYSLNESLTLGQSVEYQDEYSPELLQGVPRALSREQIGLSTSMPFSGIDIWTGYEVSWLNSKGKPQVAILRCSVQIDSINLIESKSFKLYLNSFNQTQFSSWNAVKHLMTEDLRRCAIGDVIVDIISLRDFLDQKLAELEGESIDDLDVSIEQYSPNPSLLNTSKHYVKETLNSDLLKSNCLITSQPDWASVMVRYEGPQINRESLLKYIVSFRQHNEFHEQCVERIFCDILKQCKPDKLTVYARYTRRGGLDINPFRSNFEMPSINLRLPRQ